MKMKKVISLVLALTMVLSVFVMVPMTAGAATTDTALTLGKTYSGNVQNSSAYLDYYMQGSTTVNYSFVLTASSNVTVKLETTSTTISWRLKSSDGKKTYYTETGAGTKTYYVTKGTNFILSVWAVGMGGGGKYSLTVSKAAPDKLKMKSKAGTLGSSKKVVKFKFTGTGDYALANLTVKSGNKKVATVSHQINSNNTGTFTITPQYMGKTVITLKMRGSNTLKYTAYVTKGYWFVVKGSKAKAPAPKGVSKPKWLSSKKSICTINKKTGKIVAKKGGRVTIIAKKGKTQYKINTVITDYKALGKKAYRQIKNVVNNPEKLKIYNVYKGYSKMIYTGHKVPVVFIDYGSTNDYGAMVRSKMFAYYNDVHEIKYAASWDEDNIIGKKRMPVSSIK